MKSILLATTLGLASSACAGTFKLPIHGHEKLLAKDLVRRAGHSQSPLGPFVETAGRKVKSTFNLFHKINISIGTPPQPFNVALDAVIDDFFVPSSNCHYSGCDQRQKDHPYNSSQSSSHAPNGSDASSRWAGISYDGVLSKDAVHFGDLNVTDFLFEEWTSATCYSIGCFDYGYDGVIGLAPPWKPHGGTPSMLSTLLDQDLLDSPIFSLKLPMYEDEEGEILFGATNPALNASEFYTLPITNETSDQFFSHSWTVAASHISFGSDHPLQISLPPTAYAILDVATPYLILPTELARNLTAAIGAQEGPFWFHNIPCERRQELPLLTFTLGGHNFSISAFEYTLEVEDYFPHMGRLCITTFMPSDDFFGRDWKGIFLGHPFLKGFYSRWDFGKREIGLATLASIESDKIRNL